MFGKELGLIELALALSFRKQRDGHEGVYVRPAHALGGGVAEPAGEMLVEPKFAAVFEKVDTFAGDAFGARGADGGFEVEFDTGAMETLELVGDLARKWSATSFAEGRMNELHGAAVLFAKPAKIAFRQR